MTTDDRAAMPEGAEPPPPGVKAMAIVRWALLVFIACVASFVWIAYAREHAGGHDASDVARAWKYQCPMHPQVVSMESGECPICHMDLVPIAANRTESAASKPPATAGAPGVWVDDSGAPAYTCPMHEEVRSAKPGRCPVCKMALEPIPHVHEDASAGAVSAPPPGTSPITLSVDRIQSIGVRTAVAEDGKTSGFLRVTALVAPPEQGAAEVHVRTPGFVEAVFVDQTGKEVRAGQPLLALYSPELLQAQQELLATRAWGADSPVAPGATRRKLELLGMTSAEIDRVAASKEPVRAITIAAPRGGFVMKKSVVHGSYVTPEMTLYEIVDLSRIYVLADVFLRDLAHVTVGTEARFVPSARGGGDAVTGKIDLVYPQVTADARTRKVRMVLKNEGGRTYAPGDFGTVEIALPTRSAVTIPRDALVDTGTASYVFIVEPEGRFVPRSVVVSGSDGDRIVIAEGLEKGERVVSGATFLIDSESRLRAAVAGDPPKPGSAR